MGKKVGVILVVGMALLSGCASTSGRGEPFFTRLYVGKYDDVWLATLKALNDYPLKLSNKDSGKIQSEVVNGPYNDLLFTYPEPIELPERFRYSLKFSFAKLATEDNEPLTRVRIIKDLERFQDFYTGWLPYPSDGLEEKLILYRIEHILRMQQTLARHTANGEETDTENKQTGNTKEDSDAETSTQSEGEKVDTGKKANDGN